MHDPADIDIIDPADIDIIDPADIDIIALRIAWAHWKVIYPRDVSRDGLHLWDNLGDRERDAYRAAALAVASM